MFVDSWSGSHLSPEQARTLQAWIKREGPRVESFLRSRVGASADLDDMVQTVFLELLRSQTKFRGESSFSTFVLGIASMVARRSRRPAAWDRRKRHLEFDVAEETTEPEARIDANEGLRRVNRALSGLSDKKRRAFELWAIEGRTPQEIADLTGSSVSAVRSQIFYAQKELRRCAERDPILSSYAAAA